MTTKLETLVQKWIQEERELLSKSARYQAADEREAASRYSGRADQLATKRRELQEAAGLVVMP